MNRRFKEFCLLNILIFSLFIPSLALANLQVFPTRIVLTDQKKTAHISLRHLGNSPGHYRISAVFYRMHPDGRMELVSTPQSDERSATKIVRFSPREVTLPPRVEQVLRIMLHSPSLLDEGEYRAHLYFEPSGEDLAKGRSSGPLSMQLEAKIAVAVPVIYRRGTPETSAVLSNLSLVKQADGTSAFSAILKRTGKGFLYGDFHALFTPTGGKQQEIGLVAGVSSYIDTRTVQYPLAEAKNLKGGTLRLEYRESGDDPNAKILASTQLVIF